jgi:carbon storage regulator
MLVLTRKSNQSIMIGDNIEVSVLAIMGEKVRIGIQADRTVPVFRKEVYLEIQAERGDEATEEANAQAAGGPRADAEQSTERGNTESTTTESSGGEDPHHGSANAARNGRRAVDAALRSIGGETA